MTTTFVTVDVETTGLDPYKNAMIEVAAVVFQPNGDILDEWSTLLNPNQEIPEMITRLTGISQQMVDDAPTIYSQRPHLKRLLADHVIVGHNIGFDLAFLNAESVGLGQHRVDTIALASILLPGAGRYGLNSLSQMLDLPRISAEQSHRALEDAQVTTSLFLYLFEEAKKLDFAILSEIVEAGNRLGWPETIFFEEALRVVGKGAFGRSSNQLTKLFKPEKLTGRQLIPVEKPKPIDTEALTGMLRPGGNFSRHFPAFEYREQQVNMLEAVAEAFNQGQRLIVEAGTGTGKSVGYLLPAIFWANENGRRVVVSTNTINLQDQLINKDLPELAHIVPFEVRSAILKGKRNYLCTRLFQQMRHSGPNNADEMILYGRILIWLPTSDSGDVAGISLRTPGEQMAWARLNAENDVCTIEKCAQESCPLHLARRRAEQSHILVVNHALLLADIASENRVLPEYLDLIVDEAHHLESAVTDGLSFRTDRRFLESIIEEITKPRAGLVADVQRRAAESLPQELSVVFDTEANRLREASQHTTYRLEEFFSTMDFFLKQFTSRWSQYTQQIRFVPEVRRQADFDQLEMAWENLNRQLKPIAEGFARLAGGIADISESYEIPDGEELRLSLLNLARNLEETRTNLDAMIADPDEGMIYWAEVFKERVSLHAAPLHIGPLVEQYIFETKETVILTSATLRTAGTRMEGEATFAYLKERLHAYHAEELAVGSPFDYEANTLLYLPTDIPEPNQPGYQRYVETAIIDVAKALNGRTMALFTSYKQLADTAEAIESQLADAGITVLAQSDGTSRQQLLDQFKQEDGRSVLLGTRSFWEGVDVPGAALQAVVLVKFPFDVPSDPIFAARSETFESPFFQYSIPEAILRFRQGFGRLIRRKDDEGVVVVLDKRIISKRYGQAFLEALPKCVVVRQRIGRLNELTIRWMNRERD